MGRDNREIKKSDFMLATYEFEKWARYIEKRFYVRNIRNYKILVSISYKSPNFANTLSGSGFTG